MCNIAYESRTSIYIYILAVGILSPYKGVDTEMSFTDVANFFMLQLEVPVVGT